MSDVRTVHPTRVLVTNALGAEMTEEPRIIPVESSQGSGQVLGEARFRVHIGVGVDTAGNESIAPLDFPGDLAGHYCRIESWDGSDWQETFVGTLLQAGLSDKGGGRGEQALYAEGIGGILSRVSINQGFEFRAGTPNEFVPLGHCPPFNYIPGGDCSVGTVELVAGNAISIHRRHGPADERRNWKAIDVLEYLIDACGTFGVAVIDNGILDYDCPPVDFSGMTLLDAVNFLCNARRGITYRIEYADDATTPLTIRVLSGSPVQVTVGGYTLLAASNVALSQSFSLDVSSSLWYDDPTILFDYSAVYDVFRAEGNHALVTDTLPFIKGWSDAQETAYPDDPISEFVYRRYVVATVAGSDVFNRRVIDSENDIPFLTGEIDRNGVAAVTESLALRGTMTLGKGLDEDQTGDIEPAAAFALSEGSWYYITDTTDINLLHPQLVVGGGGVSLTVTHSIGGAAITLGSVADRQILEDIIPESVDDWGVTLTYETPFPIAVEVARVSFPPTTPVRAMTLKLDADLWIVSKTAVIAVDDSGDRVFLDSAEDTIIKDDRPRLEMAARLASIFYGDGFTSVDIRERGRISLDVKAGDFLAQLTTSHGVFTTNALVTRVSHDYSNTGYSTTISTARVIPDIEAIV